MKPYEDENCSCHKIEEEINKESTDWNCGKACDEWHKRSKDLTVNDITFEPFSDENYACNCPTCGRIICGWCV